MIKNILFDLDGTLIDSPKIIMEGFKAAINEHVPGYEITEKELTAILGQTLIASFARFKKSEAHYKDLVATFRRVTYDLSNKMLEPYEGCLEVLKYLKEKGYKVGIVTSKNRLIVDENLEAVGLEEIFDVIVTSDETSVHKPNPVPLLIALERINGKASETIYIGDHENDIMAGKNADMKTGLMKYSHRLLEASQCEPDYIFDNLIKIKEIF